MDVIQSREQDDNAQLTNQERITDEFLDYCLNGDLPNACRVYSSFQVNHIFIETIIHRESLIPRLCERGHVDIITWLQDVTTNLYIDYYVILLMACETGKLLIAQWAYKMDQYITMYEEDFNYNAFYVSCRGGHIDIVKWLTEIDSNIRRHTNTLTKCITVACQKGYTDIVILLHEKFKYSFYRINVVQTFNEICKNGYIELAKWFNKTYYNNIKMKVKKIEKCNTGKSTIVWGVHSAFVSACCFNQVDTAKWLQEEYPAYDCSINNNEALQYTIMNNQLEIANWLKETSPLVKIDDIALKTFIGCSRQGHLNAIKYVWNECARHNIKLDPSDGIVSPLRFTAFKCACSNGYVGIAQWLYSLHPKVAHDHPSVIFYSIISSSHEGHLEILKWLLMIATPHTNLHEVMYSAFRSACVNGHLNCAKYIYEVYNKSNLPSKLPTSECLISSCSNHENLQLIKWLYEINPNVNLSQNNFILFSSSCKNKSDEIPKWLYSKIDSIDITADDHAAFRNACDYGRKETAQWLQSLLPLQYEFSKELKYYDRRIGENNRVADPSKNSYYEYKIREYFVVKKSIHIKDIIHVDVGTCSICLDKGCDIYTTCEHTFCKACILRWLISHNSCPYCNSKLTEDSLSNIISDYTFDYEGIGK